MRIYHKLLIGLILAVSVSAAASAGQHIDIAEKTKLQAAMQQHIDRNLVDGAYLQMNTTSGEIHTLHPYKPHPVILKMGNYFVLCSDFRDAKGTTVNVDFYVARRGRDYVVFHSMADDHILLKRLTEAGQVKRVD